MVKQLLSTIAFVILLASCSSLKPLNFIGSRQATSVAPLSKEPLKTRDNSVKFLEEIVVTPQPVVSSTEIKNESKEKTVNRGFSLGEEATGKEDPKTSYDAWVIQTRVVEQASQLQLKYAAILNTPVESLPNKVLLENVDEWYGVRYRKGGNTKSGVDCSGFSVAVYAAVYGFILPRVSREQYRTTRHISTTELQEGDLLFFDTRGRGSVSHVGIYLGNNKFIHTTVSKGVMINGLFEPYYLRRFVGAGRVDNKSILAFVSSQ